MSTSEPWPPRRRWCSGCRRERDVGDFYGSTRGRCKECRRAAARGRYEGRRVRDKLLRQLCGPVRRELGRVPADLEACVGVDLAGLAEALAAHPFGLSVGAPGREVVLDFVVPLRLFDLHLPGQRRAALDRRNLRLLRNADWRAKGGLFCGWTPAWAAAFPREAERLRGSWRGDRLAVRKDPAGDELLWPEEGPSWDAPRPHAPPNPPAAPPAPAPLPLSVAPQPVRPPLCHVDFNELLGPPPA